MGCTAGFRSMGTFRAFAALDKGAPQKVKTGNILMPALYVSNKFDRAIPGTRPYALLTQEYCVGGYAYFEANCEHDLLDPKTINRKQEQWMQEVIDAVVTHVVANTVECSP